MNTISPEGEIVYFFYRCICIIFSVQSSDTFQSWFLVAHRHVCMAVSGSTEEGGKGWQSRHQRSGHHLLA